ncbi:MAG: PstS family phosphate ABC transporter substrate-binding protein [Nitrospira sp.]|nr:PstS family phosphate ABC transporter substrate-binding protein [Nitrospira sp.]
MRRRMGWGALCVSLVWAMALLWAIPGHATEPAPLSPALSPYSKAGDLSGTLTCVGTDTLTQAMTLWAEGFGRHYPNVKVLVEGKGNTAAFAALLEGRAQVAPMSRLLDENEIARFQAAFGYRPTPYAIAVDALVVYVNKDNPIEGLTMDEVDAVFSKTPRYSYKNFTKWGQLNLSGNWGEAPINLYGRKSSSATYQFFKEHALRNDAFKTGLKEQADSQAVVQRVAEDRYGIGFSGIAFATPDVRMLALANDEFSPFVEPTTENVKNRKYPLRRYLYIYVNQAPRKILPGDKRLPPVIREFLRYVHSQEGQEAVVKSGYLPVENWIIEHALTKAK